MQLCLKSEVEKKTDTVKIIICHKSRAEAILQLRYNYLSFSLSSYEKIVNWKCILNILHRSFVSVY